MGDLRHGAVVTVPVMSAPNGPNLDLILTGIVPLDPRVSFARGSSGTAFAATGTIAAYSNNVPRFTYDPTTLLPFGLPIEEPMTALLLQSGALTTAPWGTRNSPTLTTGLSALDGTSNAIKWAIPTATDNVYDVDQSFGGSPSTTYTASVSLKDAGNRWVRMQLWDFGTGSVGGIEAWFDLVGGVVGTVNNSGAQATGANAYIIPEGNGWYRCHLSGMPSTNASINLHVVIRLATADGGTVASAPTVGNGTIAWGAQVEPGAFATSYIPTTTGTATRAAETALMSLPNGILGNGNFTVAVEALWSRVPPSGAHCIYKIHDGSDNNHVQLYNQVGQQNCFVVAASGGVNQINGNLGSKTITNGAVFKHVLRYSNGVYRDAANGSLGASSAGSRPTGLTGLGLGCSWAGDQQADNYIRRLRIWSRGLSDMEMQWAGT